MGSIIGTGKWREADSIQVGRSSPIVIVPDNLDATAVTGMESPRELEGPGPWRVVGDLFVAVVVQRGRTDKDDRAGSILLGHAAEKLGKWFAQNNLDRVFIESANIFHALQRHLIVIGSDRRELWCLLTSHAVEVEDHGRGIERSAVVKSDVLSEVKFIAPPIGRNIVMDGKSRYQARVGRSLVFEIVFHQAFEHLLDYTCGIPATERSRRIDVIDLPVEPTLSLPPRFGFAVPSCTLDLQMPLSRLRPKPGAAVYQN